LLLTFQYAADSVTVQNYFAQNDASSYALGSIAFADGTAWSYADVSRAIANGARSPSENQTLMGDASNNQLMGHMGEDRLYGLAGNDTLNGGQGNDRLEGGAGDDVLAGGGGYDSYVFGRGDGQDVIDGYDPSLPSNYFPQDQLQFNEGIDAEQLWFTRVGGDLQISVIGTTDQITVSNWYGGNTHQLGYLSLADGSVAGGGQVQALVEAMAAFSPPPPGQTTLPENYRAALQNTITANWSQN
jgi:Ca2+-binding RTX toxin-like protein